MTRLTETYLLRTTDGWDFDYEQRSLINIEAMLRTGLRPGAKRYVKDVP